MPGKTPHKHAFMHTAYRHITSLCYF